MNWYFNIYYFSFLLISILLIFSWGRKIEDYKKKKQSKVIVSSLILAVIVGTTVDVILQKYYLNQLPQIGPIIAIIPIIAVFYVIEKYEFMKKARISNEAQIGQILSEQKRIKFYKYVSFAFVFASIVTWMEILFLSDTIIKVLFFSTELLFLGIFLYIIASINISENLQDNIVCFIIAASIPIIMFNFINVDAGNMVWPIPLLLLSISAIFNKRRLFWALSFTTIISHMIIWIRVPQITFTIGSSHYFARLIIYTIGIIISYYISNTYLNRLYLNDKRIETQKMISNISKSFITVKATNIEFKINNMLKDMGMHYDIERTSICISLEESEKPICKYKWCKDKGDKAFSKMNSGMIIPIESDGRKLGYMKLESIKSGLKASEYQREMLKILSNITGDALIKVKVEDEMHHMAYYDSLTNLPNRRMLKKYLNKSILESTKNNTKIGVMLIDLDSFKIVNDTVGHEGGDELLKYVAQRLSKNMGSKDMLSRPGGDEFLIIFPNLKTVEELEKISDRIISAISKPFTIKEHEFFVTASAGVSVFPQDGREVSALLKNADLAMYESKGRGKNQWALCSEFIKESVDEITKLRNDLHKAIERNELSLFYQPQVNIENKKIIGLEALLRWKHPEKGFIPPNLFIPLAEQSELINKIGEWVLLEACRQNKIWQDKNIPAIPVSVNLSVRQLYNPELVDYVYKTIIDTRIDPKYLELEITETVSFSEEGIINDTLYKLKNLGVSISIDDFGAEYSSFGRLKKLPIDRIKIDKQFIDGIAINDKDEAIIKVIIYLSQMLELDIIAEGVEKKVQLDFLRKNSCKEVQGYYFYKPMPAKEIEEVLRSNIVN